MFKVIFLGNFKELIPVSLEFKFKRKFPSPSIFNTPVNKLLFEIFNSANLTKSLIEFGIVPFNLLLDKSIIVILSCPTTCSTVTPYQVETSAVVFQLVLLVQFIPSVAV